MATDGRPLSKKDTLHQMYQVRKPMYEAFADSHFINDSTIDKITDDILAAEDSR